MDVSLAEFSVRILLGALFVVSGGIKLRSRKAFVTTLNAHSWLPGWMHGWIGWALPVFEVLLGSVLLSGFVAVYALTSSALLLLLFSAVTGLTLYRGSEPDCGCFGDRISVYSHGPRILVRNCVLLVLNGLALGSIVVAG